MLAITINFSTPINTSIQPGDLAFFVPTTSVGSTGNTWDAGNVNNTLLLGEITSVNTPTGEVYPFGITVVFDEAIISPPTIGDFLMFAKNRKANTSSLKGYYAEMDFVNDASNKVELFSVGMEVEESSK
jgi:hypothetical protein